MKLKPLAEQVIVITGASSGIGLATAQAAVEGGARLVLAARSLETLDLICADIEDAGGSAICVAADVASREDVENVARAAIDEYGRIDTWVNNAGVSIYGTLEEVSEADNRRLFDTNFWGVVNGSLVALPHLKRHGGALINVGSEVSDAVVPLQGMYSASKHAVKGFTDALRVEVEDVADCNVSITLIQPTAVNTPYPQHARNYMECEPKLPSPRIEPEQVARRDPRRGHRPDARRQGGHHGQDQHDDGETDAVDRRQAVRDAGGSPAVRGAPAQPRGHAVPGGRHGHGARHRRP